MSDSSGGFATATVTEDGNTFQVETNTGSAKEVQANLDAKPKPKDGPPADPKKEVREKISEAASELGKKGGEAAAKARKAAERADGDSDGPEGEEGEKKGVTRPSDDEEGIEDEDGKPKGNPRHDARARIQQLARERSEERRLRQELEARLARLEAERAPARAEQPPAKDPNARPAVDQFETYEEYVEALTDWKVEQKTARFVQEQQERVRANAQAQEMVKRVDTFAEKMAADPAVIERIDPRLMELTPSYMLHPSQRPGPENVLADEITYSDVAPQLMLYLSDHEEDVLRILRLPNAREIARAVARLEDRVRPAGQEKPTEPKPSYVSAAKPPIRPVSGSAVTGDEDVTDDMDFDTHFRIMNAKEARRRAR